MLEYRFRMEEYTEVNCQLDFLERGLLDYHEKVSLEEDICVRLSGLQEDHPIVQRYHEITNTRTDASFDPENL